MSDQEQEPQEPQAPPEVVPEPTPIDPDLAFNIVAERLGYDPREARFEFEDIKRQRDDLERRRREWESERQREVQRFQPQPEFATPGERALFDIVNEMREERRQEREERRQMEEMQRQVDEQAVALRSAAESIMIQSGVKPEEVESRLPQFFKEMEEYYPDGIPARLGAYGAVRNVFRAFNQGRSGPSTNGQPRMRPQMREAVIPVGAVQSNAPRDDNDPRRRPGETTEQWVMRLRKMDEEAGPAPRIPEGQRLVIE